MSSVTNIIITCSKMEDARNTGIVEAIADINTYLESEDYPPLTKLNGREGGDRSWEMYVFGGAFNKLVISEFANAVKQARWKEPENVSMLVQGQADRTMSEVRINPDLDCDYSVEAQWMQECLSQKSEKLTREEILDSFGKAEYL